MNNLQRYVNYVTPVIEAITKHHNEFCSLEYFSVRPEDLHAADGVLGFESKGKGFPKDFDGDLPLVRATWGEESGACMILQIDPKHRDLLTTEVVDALIGKGYPGDIEFIEKWEKTADQTIWVPLDSQHYLEPSEEYYVPGYMLSDDTENMEYVGYALDFLSQRLGLPYLLINFGTTDLELVLDSHG